MGRRGNKAAKKASCKNSSAISQGSVPNLSAKQISEMVIQSGASTDADSFQQALLTLPKNEHMKVVACRAENQGSLRAKDGILMHKSFCADPWSTDFVNDFTLAMIRGMRLSITPSRPLSVPYVCRHPMLHRDSTGNWTAGGAIPRGQILVEEPCFFTPKRDRHNLRQAGAAMLCHLSDSECHNLDGEQGELVDDPVFSCAPIWSVGTTSLPGLPAGAQLVRQPWKTPDEALRMWQRAAKKCADAQIAWDKDGKPFEFFPLQGALPLFAHSCKPNAAWVIADDGYLRVVCTCPIQKCEAICVRISPDWGHAKGDSKCACGLSLGERQELWKQECVVALNPAAYASPPLPGVQVKACGGTSQLRGHCGKVVRVSDDLVEVDFESPIGRRQLRPDQLRVASALGSDNGASPGADANVSYNDAVLRELQMLALAEDMYRKAADSSANGIALGTVKASQRLQCLQQWSMRLEALPRLEETWAIASSDLPGSGTKLTVFHGRRDLKKTRLGNLHRESRIMALAFESDPSVYDIMSAFLGAAAAPAVGEPRLPTAVVLDYALRRHEDHFRKVVQALGFEIRAESKEEATERLRHVQHSSAGQKGCFFSSRRPCANIGCVEDGVRVCSECMAVHYCSELCSRAHWSMHKKLCRQKEPLIAAKPAPGSLVVAVALARAPQLNGLRGTVLETRENDATDRIGIDFGTMVGSKALRLLNVLTLPSAELPPVILCMLPCSVNCGADSAGVQRCLASIAAQRQRPARILIPWSATLEHRDEFEALLSGMENVLSIELPEMNTPPLRAIRTALEHFHSTLQAYDRSCPWLLFSEQSGIWHPDRVTLYHSTMVTAGVAAAAGADIVTILGGCYAQPRSSPAGVAKAAEVDELLRTDRASVRSVVMPDAQAQRGWHCEEDLWGSCVRLSSVREFLRHASLGVLAHESGDVALQTFACHCGVGAGRHAMAFPGDDPEAASPMWMYFLDWNSSCGGYGPKPTVKAADQELAGVVLARLSQKELRNLGPCVAESLPEYLAKFRRNIEVGLLKRVVVTERRFMSEVKHAPIVEFAVDCVKGGLAESHWRFAALQMFRHAAEAFKYPHDLKD